MDNSPQEIKLLQSCINDLMSVLALPAIWTGTDSSKVINALLDALVGMMRLDFAYVRVSDSIDALPIEFVRLSQRRGSNAHDVGRTLDPWLTTKGSSSPFVVPNPGGTGNVSVSAFTLGLHDGFGILAVGSTRTDFPTPIETLLVRVAASQAAVWLQESRRLDDQRLSAQRLEERVAERTSQLTALNEELRKEIFERERAEAESRKAEARLLAVKDELAAELIAMTQLHELGTKLLATTELQPLLETVLSATIELQHADFGNVQLYRTESKTLEIVAQCGFGPEFLDHFSRVDETNAACGRALQIGRRVIIEDVLTDQAFEPHRIIAAATGFRAVQSTPLFSRGGQPLGMISTHFREPHRPTDHQLRMTDLYARQAAEMIELKRADEELRHANARITEILESITDGFTAWDQSWRYIYVNERSAQLLGKPRDQLIGQSVWELFPEAVGTEAYLKCQQAMADRVPRYFEALFSNTWYENYVYPTKEGLSVHWRDVTEHKRIEEALRVSEERFRRYFELGLIGMAITSPRKGCLEVNDELCRILGYERSELLQKSWSELTHPDDLAADVAQFNRVLAGEFDGYTLDKRWVRKDGRIIDSIMAAKCVRRADGSVDYFVGLVQDITERKQAEESVRTAHERVEMIVNSISDNFFGLDREGRFTYFNKHAADQMRSLGKDPETLLGKVSWKEFPDMPNQENIRRVLSERVIVADELYYEPLGEWVENHMYPSNDGGLVSFQRYITQRKRTEDELHKAHAELAHVGRVTTLGELTASIAHEINQPLAAIVTNGQASLRLLSRSKPDIEEAREAVQSMIDDSLRASEVIKRIRALLQKNGPAKSTLNVNEFIQDVITFTSSELKRNNVLLLTELGPDLPMVIGDRIQLQQVMLNLIINGSEAMSSPRWKTRELQLRSEQAGPDWVLVTVKDTGIGLDSNNQERLFDPFFTGKEGGLGLGLSISRTIIEDHGGKLWAMRNEGPGASFQFRLPTVENQ